MSREITPEEARDFVRGMAWTYEFYAPRTAQKFIDQFGPFRDMTREESVTDYTRSLRKSIFADGVDPDVKHAEIMAFLESIGEKPAPYPWMIENYRANGVLLEGEAP